MKNYKLNTIEDVILNVFLLEGMQTYYFFVILGYVVVDLYFAF